MPKVGRWKADSNKSKCLLQRVWFLVVLSNYCVSRWRANGLGSGIAREIQLALGDAYLGVCVVVVISLVTKIAKIAVCRNNVIVLCIIQCVIYSRMQ